MSPKELREEIVQIVSSFTHKHGLDYQKVWRHIYQEYGEVYHIWVDPWYKFGKNKKLDFLEEYEEMYSTLTKLYDLIKTLK